MRRYVYISLALAGLFLACFGIAEALGVPLLPDPMPALRKAGPLAAVIGVGLLIADVVLPVPSSVIMLAHGALFGVWIGSILSLAGSVGCALAGFAIGRGGRETGRRPLPDAENQRGPGVAGHRGVAGPVATRPGARLAAGVATNARNT